MSGPRQEFTTELRTRDNGVVYAIVPFDPRDVWGRRRRHYIAGTVNSQPFEGSLGSRDGTWFFPLNIEVRTRIGVAAGDTITVSIEPREDPAKV